MKILKKKCEDKDLKVNQKKPADKPNKSEPADKQPADKPKSEPAKKEKAKTASFQPPRDIFLKG